MNNSWYVLLDRDGTLIEDRHYLCDPEGVVLLPGTVRGLQALTQAGFGLAVVTNQSGIGRGMFTEADMHRVNERMLALFHEQNIHIEGIFFCPHAPHTACSCRKPAPGLFEQAAHKLGLSASHSYVVGDKAADVDLGLAVGARTVLVRADRSANRSDSSADTSAAQQAAAAQVHHQAAQLDAAARAHYVAAQLDAAADWIRADRALRVSSDV